MPRISLKTLTRLKYGDFRQSCSDAARERQSALLMPMKDIDQLCASSAEIIVRALDKSVRKLSGWTKTYSDLQERTSQARSFIANGFHLLSPLRLEFGSLGFMLRDPKCALKMSERLLLGFPHGDVIIASWGYPGDGSIRQR